ncbi:site-specific integrase [Cellulosimicrobium protaetiae]
MPSDCSSGTDAVNRNAENDARLAKARVRAYTPYSIRADFWAPVAEFTRAVALDLHPSEPRRATESMRTLSQFVVWAHRQGHPLDREAMLSPDVVERYIAVGCTHLAESSRATRRADLRRYSTALTRRAPWAPLPHQLRAEYTIVPYTPAEVSRLLEVAAQQRTASRRRRLTALLALGLGAGLYPREARDAMTDDLVERHGHLCLVVHSDHPRTIPISPPYDVTLAQIKEDDPGATILGFVAKDWDRGPLGHMLEHIERPPDCPDLKTYRLRATWMLAHLDNRVHLNALSQMAGVTSWKSFSHVMKFMPQPDEAELVAEVTRP